MNERRERGWRGEWDALPERPTCAPLQAACRRPLTKPPLMRWRPGLFWGRDGGKGANPHSLKGVTFCTVTLERTGPWVRAVRAGSGCRGQKAWHLAKARALGEHLAPNPLPAPLQAGKLHRRWGLPSTSASGLLNPFLGAALPPAFLWASNYHPSHLLPLLSSLICSLPSLFTIIIITIKAAPPKHL